MCSYLSRKYLQYSWQNSRGKKDNEPQDLKRKKQFGEIKYYMDDYSDFIAKIYDPLLSRALKQIRIAVMNKFSNIRTTILDLCCGTGDQLKLFSKMV